MICPERGKPNVCNDCGEEKACSDFYQVARSPHNHNVTRCKSCARDASRSYYQEHRENRQALQKGYYQRRRHLPGKYGVSPQWYDETLAQQGGCAICGKTPEENGRRLDVDHDHRCCPGTKSCGRCVRGLLCADHNKGVGLFGDSPANLRAAADYLEVHSGTQA